jgi:hypothetical protein
MCHRVTRLHSGRLGARAVDRPNRNGYGNQFACDDCAHASLFRTSHPCRDALLEQTRSDGLCCVRDTTYRSFSHRHFREIFARINHAIGGSRTLG